MRITAFELVDHGVDGSQYFQGCGVSCTEYEACATGVGDNPAEALDDCLESVAQAGVDVDDMDARILADLGIDELPTGYVCDDCEDRGEGGDWAGGPACDGCELHYYVSIRYNAA